MPAVTIYSTDICPYCVRAKKLLDQKGASYHEINVQREPDKREEMLSRSGGRTSVPQIFIGERHVGGCDDLFALERDKKLDALLRGDAA